MSQVRLVRDYSEIKIQSGMIVGIACSVHHCKRATECFVLNFGSV